ncbi:hypothetical protein D3C85_909050 [compost metagenome]
MPQQGPIRLAQLLPDFLPVRIVGLFDIQGDQAIGMAGNRCLPFQIDTDEVKSQARMFILVLRNHRQPQVQQLRDHPPLGRLDLAPAFRVLWDAKVRDSAVQIAGNAKGLGCRARNQPIACRWGVEVSAATKGSRLRLRSQLPTIGLRTRLQR